MTKIMIVDDEPDVLYIVRKILEKEGYEVEVTYSGKDCLDTVADVKPDLIILDIMMPGLDGWEVARTLKNQEHTKDIPIIMLTVRVSDDSVERSFQYSNADGHLGKPISNEKMLNTIKWVLENKRGSG
jgi:two-component system, OmpR family, alkaline phosphatase synthesis response regulator PhoP